MMNALALSLLVSSLAAAGMFSPISPQGANTIVKEGHRVVVVEYDQDGHQNTKISISPPEHQDSNLIHNARDKIKEAASVFPNMAAGGGGSQDHHQDASAFLHHAPNPKELICDAYGRCKHKIAGVMGKAKDKAQDAIHKKKDMEEAVVDAVAKAKDKAKDSFEIGKDTGQAMKEHVVRNVSQARGAVKRFANAIASRAAFLGPMDDSSPLMGVASLLGFATAYGMCVWITFISSYVLSKAMPRQQFVVVQSKIYPVYFRAMAYSVGIALLGHVLGHRKTLFTNNTEMLQAYNLLASLLTVFFNSLYLEPRATKVMFERMKLEKEEGRGREDITAAAERRRTQEHEHTADPKTPSPTTVTGTSAQGHDAVRSRMMKLNNKLKRLNSHSSLLNILNLMSLTWHLVYLAQRVHQAC